MGGHIATDETFLIDATVIKIKCVICGTSCDQRIGWVGSKCSYCGGMWDGEGFMGSVARKRRDMMKLTRPQMSKLIGLATSTIKRYEWVRCPKSYYKKSLRIFRKYLKTNNQ